MLYAITESHLYTISLMNMLTEYADDTNVLVPSDSGVGFAGQFNHVKHWAEDNRIVITILNTK